MDQLDGECLAFRLLHFKSHAVRARCVGELKGVPGRRQWLVKREGAYARADSAGSQSGGKVRIRAMRWTSGGICVEIDFRTELGDMRLQHAHRRHHNLARLKMPFAMSMRYKTNSQDAHSAHHLYIIPPQYTCSHLSLSLAISVKPPMIVSPHTKFSPPLPHLIHLRFAFLFILRARSLRFGLASHVHQPAHNLRNLPVLLRPLLRPLAFILCLHFSFYSQAGPFCDLICRWARHC